MKLLLYFFILVYSIFLTGCLGYGPGLFDEPDDATYNNVMRQHFINQAMDAPVGSGTRSYYQQQAAMVP